MHHACATYNTFTGLQWVFWYNTPGNQPRDMESQAALCGSAGGPQAASAETCNDTCNMIRQNALDANKKVTPTVLHVCCSMQAGIPPAGSRWSSIAHELIRQGFLLGIRFHPFFVCSCLPKSGNWLLKTAVDSPRDVAEKRWVCIISALRAPDL